MNRVMTAIAISSTTAFLVASSPNVVAAAARTDAPQPRGGHETATDRQGETRRILSILTRKIADPMVRRRATARSTSLRRWLSGSPLMVKAWPPGSRCC